MMLGDLEIMHPVVTGVAPGIMFLILGLLLLLGECCPQGAVNNRGIMLLLQGALKAAVAGVAVVLYILGNLQNGRLVFGPGVVLATVYGFFFLCGVIELIQYRLSKLLPPWASHVTMASAVIARILVNLLEPTLHLGNLHWAVLSSELMVLVTTILQCVLEESSGVVIARGFCLAVLGAWQTHCTILLQEEETELSPWVLAQLLWDVAAVLVLTLVVGVARLHGGSHVRRQVGSGSMGELGSPWGPRASSTPAVVSPRSYNNRGTIIRRGSLRNYSEEPVCRNNRR